MIFLMLDSHSHLGGYGVKRWILSIFSTLKINPLNQGSSTIVVCQELGHTAGGKRQMSERKRNHSLPTPQFHGKIVFHKPVPGVKKIGGCFFKDYSFQLDRAFLKAADVGLIQKAGLHMAFESWCFRTNPLAKKAIITV